MTGFIKGETSLMRKTAGFVGAAIIVAGIPVAAFALGPEQLLEFTEGEITDAPAFESVALRGGGEVRISHGEDHSFRVVEGGEATEVLIEDGAIKVRCKKKNCRKYKGKRVVEITAPALEDIALVGGGLMTVSGDFPVASEVNVALVGGGKIDAFDLPGREVNAAITGGGLIQVTAEVDLSAAIVGGGKIEYRGDPEVSRSILGGGAIQPE